MNPTRPLFGRLTINSKRTDLGHATFPQLLQRAAQTFIASRSDSRDLNIIMEVSAAQLPDSSILSREQQLEQSIAAHVVTDGDEESPFEGITIARVQEAMSSQEYSRYAEMCLPDKRLGVPDDLIFMAREAYRDAYPDCFEHFPRWIES